MGTYRTTYWRLPEHHRLTTVLSEIEFGIELECFFRKGPEGALAIERIQDMGLQIKPDESIQPDYPAIPAELDIGVWDITPESLQKAIRTVNTLFDMGAEVNSSCGSHVHYSSPGYGPIEHFWFMYWFHRKQGYDIFRQFAGVDQFDEVFASIEKMKHTMSVICDWVDCSNKDKAAKRALKAYHFLEGEKFNLIRLHPQGTIEWRGLRGLMQHHDRALTSKAIQTLIPDYARAIIRCMESDNLQIASMNIQEYRNRLRSVLKSHLRQARNKFPSNLQVTSTYQNLTNEKLAIVMSGWPNLEEILRQTQLQKDAKIYVEANRVILSGLEIDNMVVRKNSSSFHILLSECTMRKCLFEHDSIGFEQGILLEDSQILECDIGISRQENFMAAGLEFGNSIETLH